MSDKDIKQTSDALEVLEQNLKVWKTKLGVWFNNELTTRNQHRCQKNGKTHRSGQITKAKKHRLGTIKSQNDDGTRWWRTQRWCEEKKRFVDCLRLRRGKNFRI